MTCIVGLIDKGNVYVGGDSAGAGNYSISYRKDPKVFQRGPFLFGFTSSFRMGQLLMHDEAFKLREQKEKEDEYEYMVSVFIPAVRELFRDGGWLKKEESVELGGVFLVGYKGRLFKIYADFQVAESIYDYETCGCGEDLALGSLENKLTVTKRIKLALQSAEKFSSGVSQPFKILKLEEES